ncbi:hypothetical protein TROPICALSUN_44 [Erwinia phage vB_EamM_TropicalSun]|uniref:Uncharacterized protein n=4 Tax=Myosmarvirus TaxID=2843428 RepID=A0A9E8JXE9_9CAUD|nr:hypothetical protein HWC56_gp050 [Serratia phage MyoSmar]QEG09499.1 hypothetical protein CPT_MyoSmar_050 [Serratia phage MyoSmar]QEG13834.1 hypothetical protein TROPICALSUN_44 [Erwinia phage vB_EamM_TropicalSun]UZS00345.1 hypothetical protein [Serratia phage SMP]
MATFYDIEPSKSYATPENAHKAVAKLNLPDDARYIVLISTSTTDYAKKHLGRYIVVFIGMNCLQYGIPHKGFNVVA